MFIVEAVFSGFVSKAVNDVVDISKGKIKKAIDDKNTSGQSLESQIYHVIVNVLHKITCNQYENNPDKIYEVAEKLLKDYQSNNSNDIMVIKSSLKIFYSYVEDEKCIEFKKFLYQEISKKENVELYHQILLLLLEQKNTYDSIEIRQLKEKLDIVIQILNEKDLSHKEQDIVDNTEKFKNNKKLHYIDIWNSRLFLHLDNDERPLTLSDAFIVPDYRNHEPIEGIEFSKNDTLDDVIDEFINYDRTSTMLITGVPGIGKTSIVARIANNYKNDDNVIILRFRDWEIEELGTGLLKAIYNTLECKKKDLDNKVLILDGFDEIKALDIRDRLLINFFYNIDDLQNFKCIITSRPHYINYNYFENVFEVQKFDVKKITDFYQEITGNQLLIDKDKIESNLDVLGIPVILYMAIMSGINIAEESTKPELYNRIFAEKGGIFDKFYYKGKRYDNGTQILKHPENIKKYLKFLRDVAFKMFEKKNLSLQKGEYEVPELELDFQEKKISILEFPIKYLFEKTEFNIEFIHKSIYEYFVSEYIFKRICETIDKSKEELASFLGNLLKNNDLTSEILEFLQYKVRNDKLKDSFYIIKETFDLMLQDGMTYYTGKCFKNVIDCEMNIFAKMLEIIHLWDCKELKFNFIFKYIKCNLDSKLNFSEMQLCEALTKKTNLRNADLIGANLRNADFRNADFRDVYLRNAYLRNADLTNANLIRVNLRGADLIDTKLIGAKLIGAKLRGVDLITADLTNANLTNADLTNADLRGANFRNADLNGADLNGTDLRGAILEEANLYGANLERAIFDESQIEYLKEKYNLQGARVSIKEPEELITYEEYHKKKQ